MKNIGWQLTVVLLVLLVAVSQGLQSSEGTSPLGRQSGKRHGSSRDGLGGVALSLQNRAGGRAAELAFPDVAPVTIDEPWDTVWCYDTVLVAATVCNFGDTNEPFDVEALIDTSGVVIYADTQTVVSLDPGNCTDVNFVDWIVPDVNIIAPCVVRVTTLLASDIIPGNDTLTKSVTIWCAAYHDVSVVYIDEPWDTVWCGDTSAVVALVCNWGDTVETFDVEALIDLSGVPIYTDTQSVVDLEPDSCVYVSFADWPVPGGHLVSFNTTVTALLAGDMDPASDTLRTTSTNWCPSWRDVALDSISSPPDTVLCDSVVPVVAVVCNLGETIETFDVEALISDTSGLPVYADTVTVVGLVPDSCVDVPFVDWVVPSLDSISYDVTIAALLPVDADTSNDSASKMVFCWCWQTGAYETIKGTFSPRAFRLGAPSPNPTRGESRIDYSLPSVSDVTLRIYDVRGTVVKTLVDGSVPAGSMSARWDGRDGDGRPAPSGIYFFELNALPEVPGHSSFRSSGKLLLLR